jgi:cytochrome c5
MRKMTRQLIRETLLEASNVGGNDTLTAEQRYDVLEGMGTRLFSSINEPTPAVTAAGEDDALLEVIDERDRYHAMADKLASAIVWMARAGDVVEVIGEHSNMNCPWENALELANNHAHPSAGAVAEAEQDKIEQAEGERIFDRVCEALKLDPNDGDCDSGDHADFIVSAVQRHIERLSVAQPSAGAEVTLTHAEIEAGIEAIEQLPILRQKFTAEQKRQSFITAALAHRPTSEGREDA